MFTDVYKLTVIERNPVITHYRTDQEMLLGQIMILSREMILKSRNHFIRRQSKVINNNTLYVARASIVSVSYYTSVFGNIRFSIE